MHSQTYLRGLGVLAAEHWLWGMECLSNYYHHHGAGQVCQSRSEDGQGDTQRRWGKSMRRKILFYAQCSQQQWELLMPWKSEQTWKSSMRYFKGNPKHNFPHKIREPNLILISKAYYKIFNHSNWFETKVWKDSFKVMWYGFDYWPDYKPSP